MPSVIATGVPPSHEEILFRARSLAALGKLHGIFPDIPLEVYNDPTFPGVRSSDIKTIIKLNYERWELRKREETADLNFGQALHSLLAGDEVDTKPLFTDQLKLLSLMDQAVDAHPRASQFSKVSQHEVTFIAMCPITGILLRCRADLWNQEERVIADWKTCQDASPHAFQRDAKKYGYKLSAAFYVRVIRLVMGSMPSEFRIYALEKLSPWGIGTYSYFPDDLEDAQLDIDVGLNRIVTANEGGWKSYDLEPRRLRY